MEENVVSEAGIRVWKPSVGVEVSPRECEPGNSCCQWSVRKAMGRDDLMALFCRRWLDTPFPSARLRPQAYQTDDHGSTGEKCSPSITHSYVLPWPRLPNVL